MTEQSAPMLPNRSDDQTRPAVETSPVSTTEKKNSSFQAKDFVAIAISVLALCVSTSGFYFQNVRVSHLTHATPLNTSVGPGTLTCDLLLFNDGNRDIQIDSVDFVVFPERGTRPDFETVIGVQESSGNPIRLEPRKLLNIALRSKFETDDLIESGGAREGALAKENNWKLIRIGVRVKSHDSAGKLHHKVGEAFTFQLKNDGTITAPKSSNKPFAIN